MTTATSGLDRLKMRIETTLNARPRTVRALARQLGVEESTVRRALSELQREGLVDSDDSVAADGPTGRPRKIWSLA